MSRKTKAELEAEITVLKGRYKALGVMYKSLEKRFGQLEDEHQNLQGYIKLLHQMGDEDQRNLKIETESNNDNIQRLAKLSRPRIRREWAALERKKFLQSRFAEYRRQELNITESRGNANNDMARKFGEKHRLKPRRLIEICKD